MSDTFIKFQECLKRLEKAYRYALYSFYVLESIEELKAPNINGENAYINVETMRRFNNFFITVKYATNFHFLIELAKLFDDAKQSLHIKKLINFSKSNNNNLTSEDFKHANQDRDFIERLVREYKGITRKDLLEIENLLNTNQGIIKRLIDYRNQNLAHEDKNKQKIIITNEEIKILFNIIKKILNIFSYKTNFVTTIYNHIEENCKNDTKNVIEYLSRFEKYRLKEIEEDLNHK